MIVVGIQNILLINVRETIMNFCLFFNAICQKALESLEKGTTKFMLPRDLFSPAFFDISVHFTTHLIKEIKVLGPMFLHQMYVYERFNGILKSFIRN
jgi:hypothetical protein